MMLGTFTVCFPSDAHYTTRTCSYHPASPAEITQCLVILEEPKDQLNS